MNKYFLPLVMVVSFGAMPMSMCADNQYAVSILDEARITRKKEHFDRKVTRMTYIRYGSVAAIAAGLAYLSYTSGNTPAQKDLSIPTADTFGESLAKLQKEVAELKKDENWLQWLIDRTGTAFVLRGLTHIATDVAFSELVWAPIQYADASSYEFRSDMEGMYIRGIVVRGQSLSRYTLLDPLTDDEKRSLFQSIQYGVLQLKKQLEVRIGFMRHKQAQSVDAKPQVVTNIDNEIRYLMLCYEEFAHKLEEALNDHSAELSAVSASIVACAKQFGEECRVVKDNLRVLEQELLKEAQ